MAQTLISNSYVFRGGVKLQAQWEASGVITVNKGNLVAGEALGFIGAIKGTDGSFLCGRITGSGTSDVYGIYDGTLVVGTAKYPGLCISSKPGTVIKSASITINGVAKSANKFGPHGNSCCVHNWHPLTAGKTYTFKLSMKTEPK